MLTPHIGSHQMSTRVSGIGNGHDAATDLLSIAQSWSMVNFLPARETKLCMIFAGDGEAMPDYG